MLVRDVVSRFHEAAHGGGSALTVTAAEGPVFVNCDPLRIEQVLSNPIKYGGGQPIEVKVALRSDGGSVVVADKGIGIPPDKIGAIFNRFERGEARRNYAGLGLGLYIARQIVEAHHGLIHVTSEQGKGSVFTVDVPFNPREQTAPNQ